MQSAGYKVRKTFKGFILLDFSRAKKAKILERLLRPKKPVKFAC